MEPSTVVVNAATSFCTQKRRDQLANASAGRLHVLERDVIAGNNNRRNLDRAAMQTPRRQALNAERRRLNARSDSARDLRNRRTELVDSEETEATRLAAESIVSSMSSTTPKGSVALLDRTSITTDFVVLEVVQTLRVRGQRGESQVRGRDARRI